MDPAQHLAHLRADGDAIVAAQAADPAAPVDSCPGWDRTVLLAHVGGLYSWVQVQLARGPEERIGFKGAERPPEGDAMPGWAVAQLTGAIDAMSSMDVEATWPTWAGPHPGTWFPRRMSQETLIHRWDAVGGAIDPGLAVDGIDELLQIFVPRLPADRLTGAAGTIHLHATDVEGEWLVRLSPEGITFEHGHAKGDVALRGTAADLLLWAWNRVPVDDRFQVFGDDAPLTAWRELVVF
jgi:uncharacterized protein (TIGR03083 family)